MELSCSAAQVASYPSLRSVLRNTKSCMNAFIKYSFFWIFVGVA
jgi:hypothetical protein